MKDVRTREAGLSLVEVMAVLAIVGVMSGTAMMTIYSGRSGAEVETESLRLAGRLQLAADQALLTGVAGRLDWDATGYRFLRWDPEEGEWRSDPRAALSDRHELASGLRLAGPEGSVSVLIAPDGIYGEPFLVRSESAVGTVSFNGLIARATLEAER